MPNNMKSKDYMMLSILTLSISLVVLIIKLVQTKKLVSFSREEGWIEGFESAAKSNYVIKKKGDRNETSNS